MIEWLLFRLAEGEHQLGRQIVERLNRMHQDICVAPRFSASAMLRYSRHRSEFNRLSKGLFASMIPDFFGDDYLDLRFAANPSDFGVVLALACKAREAGESARAAQLFKRVANSRFRERELATHLLRKHFSGECGPPARVDVSSRITKSAQWHSLKLPAWKFGAPPAHELPKKLHVHLPEFPTEAILAELGAAEDFAARKSFDLILSHEGMPDSWAPIFERMQLRNARTSLFPLPGKFDAALDSLLAAGSEGLERIAVASHSRFLSDSLAEVADVIVLYRGGHAPGGVDPESRRNCTLITSVFRSDEYLESFAANSIGLNGYGRTIDHIFLISATSPKERQILIRHLGSCDNVLFVRNGEDPGLYSCWNLGISLARTDYVSNANVDDLRAADHVLKLTDVLDRMDHIGVACSAIVPFHQYPAAVSGEPSTAWFSNSGGEFGYFDLAVVHKDETGNLRLKSRNLPHCMPVWRKALHAAHGFFNEERYGTFADWALWLSAFRNGLHGYLHPEPLAFYFVNPDSHNRRGEGLDKLHRRIEEENLPAFASGGFTRPAGRRPLRPPEPKLNLGFTQLEYGHHRNSFGMLVESLRPLHLGGGGITFLPFIERYFQWGSSGHEARSKDPRPIAKPWIGIIHVPFDSPEWFAKEQRPEAIFETKLWKESFPECRGLICLSEDLQADLKVFYPHLPSLAVKHPTDLKTTRFDFQEYLRKPRVVQAGDWLRQVQAIYRIKGKGHRKLMLRKRTSIKSLEREIKEMGNFTNKSVTVKDFVSNDDYDKILSSSVVLCLLYATAANNLVLECIARHTPIIINPLPSVVEYLGEDYPLYASTVEQADLYLSDREMILAASCYLKERQKVVDFSYRAFRDTIASSDFYGSL
jgi:hypothetical protein